MSGAAPSNFFFFWILLSQIIIIFSFIIPLIPRKRHFRVQLEIKMERMRSPFNAIQSIFINIASIN